jgi:hypothetical protein
MSAEVATLAKGVLRGLVATKLKVTTTVVVAVDHKRLRRTRTSEVRLGGERACTLQITLYSKAS